MIPPELKKDYSLKWERMQEFMQKECIDGCLLTIDVNLLYTTGKIYDGYFYLPQQGEPWFFIRKPNGWSGEHIVYIRKPEQLPEVFTANRLEMPESLLLEADELSYNEYVRLTNIFNPGKKENATAMLRRMREIKTPYEIAQIRKCARLHSKTYSEIKGCFRSGMTDIELQYEIERIMRKNGSLGVFRTFGKNMEIFMGSILAGAENGAAPSPFDFALGGKGLDASIPLGANGTVLKPGMSVMIDMAGNFTPYMTDMTRTFSVGKLAEPAYRAHQVSIEIHQTVMNIAKPGISCAELYNIAAEIVERNNLSAYFMGSKQQAKFVGHGIGLQINELPVLTPRSKEVLQPDMVFALEPKFVIPDTGAIGIENSYLVTGNGVEKLTVFPEEIIEF